MTIPLQRGIIYGPVRSRRLGRSLGINLLPTSYKICTFNCLYCQYGWTRIHGRFLTDRDQWPQVNEVYNALERSLREISPLPDYITFSGNGEPTIYPDFPVIVEGVMKLRNDLAPHAKVAILSNSTMVTDENILATLSRLDVKIMKMDCGTIECFKSYNRPAKGVYFEEIVKGLAKLENITIQSLFSGGPKGNFYQENIEAWIDNLQQISPSMVQLYTLDRSFPSDKIVMLNKDRLIELKERLNEFGIDSEVY
jgi:wyosine [tRNA(Phe)-imidazoG37] synthetase (radical SAM superfamily)